ncbi:MAG: VWA domain-containing protein [Clostridiales Family XIII bacterium]|jgi:hypothetical protein|nr:VWA domain-containing protein [Clostridiales Family XIII bacterium]
MERITTAPHGAAAYSLKKLFGCLLVLAMLITLLPANAAYAAPSVEIAVPDDPANTVKYPVYPNEGSVRMTKSAEWTNADETLAKITFDVGGVPVPIGGSLGMDVVVAVDTSGLGDSQLGYGGPYGTNNNRYMWDQRAFCPYCDADMGVSTLLNKWYGNRLYCPLIGGYHTAPARTEIGYMRRFTNPLFQTFSPIAYEAQATKEFARTFLAESLGNRVALVTYGQNIADGGSTVRVKSGLTSNIEDIRTGLRNEDSYGDNPYTLPLQEALKILNARADKTRPAAVVFFTLTAWNTAPATYQTTALADYKLGTTAAKVLRDTGAKIYALNVVGTNQDAIEHYGNPLPQITAPMRAGLEGLVGTHIENGVAVPNTDQYSFSRSWPELQENVANVADSLRRAGTEAKIRDVVNVNDFDILDVNVSKGTIESRNLATGEIVWSLGDVPSEPSEPHATMEISVRYAGPAARTTELYATNAGRARIDYKNYRNTQSVQYVDSPKIGYTARIADFSLAPVTTLIANHAANLPVTLTGSGLAGQHAVFSLVNGAGVTVYTSAPVAVSDNFSGSVHLSAADLNVPEGQYTLSATIQGTGVTASVPLTIAKDMDYLAFKIQKATLNGTPTLAAIFDLGGYDTVRIAGPVYVDDVPVLPADYVVDGNTIWFPNGPTSGVVRIKFDSLRYDILLPGQDITLESIALLM